MKQQLSPQLKTNATKAQMIACNSWNFSCFLRLAEQALPSEISCQLSASVAEVATPMHLFNKLPSLQPRSVVFSF